MPSKGFQSVHKNFEKTEMEDERHKYKSLYYATLKKLDKIKQKNQLLKDELLQRKGFSMIEEAFHELKELNPLYYEHIKCNL